MSEAPPLPPPILASPIPTPAASPKAPIQPGRIPTVFIAFGIVIGLMGLVSLARKQAGPPVKAMEASQPSRIIYESEGEALIVRGLRDPDSFKLIGWEGPWRIPKNEKVFGVRCNYRAKNGFGGYSFGRQDFICGAEGHVLPLPNEGAGSLNDLLYAETKR